MRFCFRFGGITGLAALALWAGGPASAPSTGISTVIRTDPRTGKLVRAVTIQNPAALTAAVDRIAAQNSLPPQLVHSVIQTESNYDPNAVSPKGARGLMQLIPATARRFGVADAFNPIENLQGGTRYLKYLLDLYHGDYPLALAAYNAGEQSVARYGGVPPFPETRKYVAEVAKRLPNPKPAEAPKPALHAAAPDGGNHIHEVVLPDGSVRYVAQPGL